MLFETQLSPKICCDALRIQAADTWTCITLKFSDMSPSQINVDLTEVPELKARANNTSHAAHAAASADSKTWKIALKYSLNTF